MKTTKEITATTRDVEEVIGSLGESLSLEADVSTSSQRLNTSSDQIDAVMRVPPPSTCGLEASTKLKAKASVKQDKGAHKHRRRATASDSIGSSGGGSNQSTSNGSSSNGNSNATSQNSRNVVTNTNTSSSGEDRGSSSNTWSDRKMETHMVEQEQEVGINNNASQHQDTINMNGGDFSHSRRLSGHHRPHKLPHVAQHETLNQCQHEILEGKLDDDAEDLSGSIKQSSMMDSAEMASDKTDLLNEACPDFDSMHSFKRKRPKKLSINKPQDQFAPMTQRRNSKNSTEENLADDSGYDASASSNDASGNSSPSVSSSESSRPVSSHRLSKRRSKTLHKSNQNDCKESSSDLADFSSGVSSEFSPSGSPDSLFEDSEEAGIAKPEPIVAPKPQNNFASTPFASAASEASVALYSPRNTIRSAMRAKKIMSSNKQAAKSTENESTDGNISAPRTYSLPDTWSFVERQLQRKMNFELLLKKKTNEEHFKELNANFQSAVKRIRHLDSNSSISSIKSALTTASYTNENAVNCFTYIKGDPTIYDVGVDVMSKILTFLKPTDVYSMMTMPISKTFRATFSVPQNLWKILCLSEPFNAKVDRGKDGSDDSISSYPICKNLEVKHALGRYRLLYSSFVKCVKYLDRVKEDAKNGRTPAGTYDSDENSVHSYADNSSLQQFFAEAHRLKRKERSNSDSNDSSSSSQNSEDNGPPAKKNKNEEGEQKKPKAKVKFGVSKLTNNLLAPVHSAGVAGNVGLPWSCAIYSVVNWMVAFADVSGIQLMCLKVLPDLLVDEQQRMSAQHAGLTDIVLRAMVLFPDNVEIHTAAFHTLVLLARPLGGKEGMLFHSAMVRANGIFNIGSSTGKSGIAIMLDSMKRFVDNEDLQAMSCWSMVNIALIPSQKVVLVRLGGISAAANAMVNHPYNAEVQFRALFALINLVIPSQNLSSNATEAHEIDEQVAGMNQDSETEMIDESLEQVTNLVVVAMKNFCSNESILNRACLVLHNLSLNDAYHRVLLLTPNCYQMLEWCIENYKHDNVLQQSARGTLQRLQQSISSKRSLRREFEESLVAQRQHALESARLDAALLKPFAELGQNNRNV